MNSVKKISLLIYCFHKQNELELSSSYLDVNGKTLHLVQRAPPAAAPSANQGGNTSQSSSTTTTGPAGLEGFLRNNLGGILGGGGATGAGAGGQIPQGLQQLIQNAIGGLGGGANVVGATTAVIISVNC